MIPTPISPELIALLGGSIGSGEMLLLFAVVLMLFGPRKLPEVARMLGRAMHELRRATNDFRNQIVELDVENPSSGKASAMSKTELVARGLIQGSMPRAEVPEAQIVPEPPVTASGGEPPKEA